MWVFHWNHDDRAEQINYKIFISWKKGLNRMQAIFLELHRNILKSGRPIAWRPRG